MATAIAASVARSRAGDEKLFLRAPYHPELPPRARALGGTWIASAKQWAFDPRDADRVAVVCLDLFGRDWCGAGELVTVQLTIPPGWDGSVQDVWAFGREILRRPGRDAAVYQGDGVVLVSGSFASSGGTRSSPMIGPPAQDQPVVLEIRDVPAALLDQERGIWGDSVTVVDDKTPPAALPASTHFAPPGQADEEAEIVRLFKLLPAIRQVVLLERLQQTLPSTQ